MYLVQLIYASKVTEGFDHHDIKSILKSAQANNSKAGVTGLLCFSQENFLQCLEGPRTQVNHIYQKILQDSRHHTPVLLHYEGIEKRQFERWAMGYVPETHLVGEVVLKYSNSTEFDPFKMAGGSARSLMVDLIDDIPTETGEQRKAV